MRVLLDANIWIDLAVRPSTQKHSISLYQKLEEIHHIICFPLCAYTTVHYVIQQTVNQVAATEFLNKLVQRRIRFVAFREPEVRVAHSLTFDDHEDACIAASALACSAEYIVTRNINDFSRSPVAAIEPKKLLHSLK